MHQVSFPALTGRLCRSLGVHSRAGWSPRNALTGQPAAAYVHHLGVTGNLTCFVPATTPGQPRLAYTPLVSCATTHLHNLRTAHRIFEDGRGIVCLLDGMLMRLSARILP